MANNEDFNSFEAREKDAKIVRKAVFIILSVLFIIMIIVGVSGVLYVNSALKPVNPKNKDTIEVEIPLGSSTSQIAQTLEDNDVIKNGKIFKFYIKFKNHSNFQAGTYALSQNLTLEEIIAELQTGKVVEEPLFRVTIPEGKTIEEIADIFAHKLSFTNKEFLKTLEDEKYIEQLMDSYPTLLTKEILNKEIYVPLEGYLFAGTYDIYDEELTPSMVIDMMVARTSDIIEEVANEVEKSDLSIHEILTLASIIERESKFSEDRPKVSQVYFNRLQKNMKLQSDITAFYGIQHKAVVTYDDIKIDTPYNTYVIDGLPVGPINSPSLESIKAVLHPEGDKFEKLFYFSRPTGETFYSETLDEHNQVKEQYRHEWYELENEAKE